MHNPLVVAIVLNWNSAEETAECIRSLLSSSYDNLLVVIVDNASTDNSVEYLTAAFPSIRILTNNVNTGYAGGNNLGVKWALNINAEYILILNNDVIVDINLVSTLIDKIKINSKIGVITGKVYYKDNQKRIYSGAGKFVRWRCSGVNRGAIIDRMSLKEKDCDVDFLSGALFLTRVEVFRRVGLLDERYFMYFEDLDFSRKVLKQYSIIYTPQAISYHKSGGGTHWGNYSDIYLYYHTRNRFIVFEHENIFYKCYVVLFTIGVTMAKAIAILVFSLISDDRDVKRRMSALWKGLKDGVEYYMSR
jgi:GT2 family glycosyltransferase